MNKEILEVTKKFHDTYEKLAKEYNYTTREDTKVFDINSNNGKLMYAVVNEIVNPTLKENKELKKQLKGTTHCFDEEEHERLKKQLEECIATNEVLSHELTKDKILKQDHLTTCCGIPIGDIPKLKKQLEETNRKLFFTKNELNMRQKSIDNKLNQQKEFIKWLEDYLKLFDNMNIEEQVSYDTIEEILQEYKEIVNGIERR